MQRCGICGGTDFYVDSGYYYCVICQTQIEDIREEVLEVRIDATTKLRKTRVPRVRRSRTDEDLGWTSWELYNFVLIGLTNELIELGAPADVKVTVLQLWARYLGKLEIAFTSTKKKLVPKLARRYKKRDAEIIYGKILSEKRARKRKSTGSSVSGSMISTYQSEASSTKEFNRNKKLMITADYDRFMQSQASSEGDALSGFNQSIHSVQSSVGQSSENGERIQFNSSAKKEAKKVKNMAKKVSKDKRSQYKQNHITTRYKMGPQLITPTRLWAILYLALRIHKHSIHLSDMLRYAREGHLSYHKLDHLIPPEVTLTKSDHNFLSRVTDITHKGMRRIIGSMAKFLGVTKIICPDFLPLINRYCIELDLPRGISLYGERLIALSPPKMKFDKKSYIPNYEGRAMAFIIVVLKILLALDGITEYEISNVVDRINSVRKMFSDASECRDVHSYESQKHFRNDIQNTTNDSVSTMQCQCEDTPCILVHGDVESFNDALIVERTMSCKKAARTGYQSLLDGATAVEAVETALWWLECDEFFNCGYGSVLNEIGDVQMDASITDGSKLACGSVAAVSDIEHPISLARYVLDNHPNSIVVGEGARQLAKCAKLNWLSKGNLIAPTAYLAHKLEETDDFDATDWDTEDQQFAEVLKNGGSTVGCVAYDGCTIAAGITSGGTNKKLVGSVGGSSILGCGAYADRNVGCSLAGHGASIVKLGLSRAVASDTVRECSPRRALKRNLDYILTKHNHRAGGVAFKRPDEWGVYFTSDKMPYAVIANDRVTFGATSDDKNVEAAIGDEAISDTKLFSFREWQRYIECRRTVLINAHLPTRLKCNPSVPDVNGLYIKFLEFVHSKMDRDERPEVTTRKHLLPRDLIHAMKQCLTNVNHFDSSLNETTVFAPSLTPHHSYLQQLLEHPLYDLPSVLRSGFFSTRVGYTTKLESICDLALRYDVNIDIADSNLHFIEKTVPFFEQTRLTSVKDSKDHVTVHDFLEEETERSETKEDFIEYLHRKIPCRFRMDARKKRHYDEIRSAVASATAPPSASASEFVFDEILPNGKLSIPSKDDDDKDEMSFEDDDTFLRNIFPEKARSLSEFCSAYDVNLSSAERAAILSNSNWKSKRKRKPLRNAHGKFVKRNDISRSIQSSDEDGQADSIPEDYEIKDTLPDVSDIPNLTDESLLDDLIKTEIGHDDLHENENCKEVSESVMNGSCRTTDRRTDNPLRLFRPFQNYWMYHCNFSRVKPKNFELFEKMLPRSFRWLLNECANVVEMSTEDLYEEVCLVEAYHANIFKQSEMYTSTTTSNENRNSQAYVNAILNKW